MSIRIGAWIIGPNALLLPLAMAFFVTIAFKRLYPRIVPRKLEAALLVSDAALGALFGAAAVGVIGGAGETGHASIPIGSAGLSFGSFGAYWGALVAVSAAAWFVNRRDDRQSDGFVLACADALVPGLIVAGCIGRLGCLFSGCCRGIWLTGRSPDWLQPLWPVPAYDIAALCLTALLIREGERRRAFDGLALCMFLILYGSLRFSIEFMRPDLYVLGILTTNHFIAFVQVLVGLAITPVVVRRSSTLWSG